MMIPPRAPEDPRNGPVWLRSQLIEGGITDRAIARMLEAGLIERLRRGAYTPREVWDALDADGRYGLRVRAAVANARTGVVVSHVSGLPELGASTWGLDTSEVHLTRDDGLAGRVEAGIHQHAGRIVEETDVVAINGLRVMHPARLALEVSTVAPLEAALCVTNDLLHRGVITTDELRGYAGTMTHWPNSLKTDLVVRLADSRIESVAESRTFYLCWRHRIPRPVPQFPILDESGRTLYRVDFAWPELGVFLEFDGLAKYRDVAQGDDAAEVVIREKLREDDIRRRTGWRCLRITWADLEHPERTAARLRAALTQPKAA